MDPMSMFGICVSAATLLSNACDLLNIYRNAQNDFHKMYDDCQKLARVLRSLQSECGMVKDLDVVFVMDHCTKTAKSLEDFQVLLEATGLFGTNKRIASFTREEDANGDLVSPFSIHALRKELQKMARTNRLILVSKAALATIVREAVGSQDRLQSNDLKERIAAIISICNSNSATSCTAQTLQSYEARPPVLSLQDDASYENMEAIFSECDENEQAVAPGVHIGQLSTYASRTSEWVVQKGAPPFLAVGCSVSYQYQKDRSQEYCNRCLKFETNWIRCPRDEIQDCALWSILHVIEKLRGEKFQDNLVRFQTRSDANLKDPVTSLDGALRCRTGAEAQAILKAIQWVGFAFRPLAVEELLHAINSNADVSPAYQDVEVCPAGIQTGEQLMELCAGLLEVNDAKLVDFTNANLRSLVLSGKFPGTSLLGDVAGHEMLAMVCVKHSRCLDRQTPLKPWISTTHWLLDVRHKCPLRSYATNFWDAHSRLAQSKCRYLPMLLHQAILGALSKDDKGDPFYMPTTRGRTNVGLWLCSFYGFKPLVQTYLEMGADPNGWTFWPITPLHAATARSDFETVKLLLDRGGNPDIQDEKGFTSFDIAYATGDEQIACLLNRHTIHIEGSAAFDAKLDRSCLCDSFHSPQKNSGLPFSDAGNFFLEYENQYNRGNWPDGEPGDSREILAVTTHQLKSLAFQRLPPSNLPRVASQKADWSVSPKNEGWVVVGRDDINMDMP